MRRMGEEDKGQRPSVYKRVVHKDSSIHYRDRRARNDSLLEEPRTRNPDKDHPSRTDRDCSLHVYLQRRQLRNYMQPAE